MPWHILLASPAQVFIALFLMVLLYFLITFLNKSGPSFPPGPNGLPIVGYLPFLSKNIHLNFTELGKKYGPIYSIKLGNRTAVVLCKTSDIREAMVKREFLGRQPNNISAAYGHRGVFFTNQVDAWRDHKKFVVLQLSDIRPELSRLETCLRDEVECFLEAIESLKGNPFYLEKYLRRSVVNNMCAFAFGRRYTYDDPELLTLSFLDENMQEKIRQTKLNVFFPWIIRLPFIDQLFGGKDILQIITDLKLFITKKIDDHKNTYEKECLRDFIDQYLKEMNTKKEENQSTKFSEAMLVYCAMDLFAAGTLTVLSTIRWCVYIIAAYPNVKNQIQKEIDEVIGSGRRPEYSDRKNMPYTHSVILETLRWRPVLPIGIIKCTISDATLSGYKIPKGTDVFTNIWAVHHDPEYWDDPEDFRPERFLGPDGTVGAIPDHFMPFMVGRRLCAGEKLANMELFLYITSLLQKFDVVFPSGFEPTFEAQLNLDYGLVPFEVRFIPRNSELNV